MEQRRSPFLSNWCVPLSELVLALWAILAPPVLPPVDYLLYHQALTTSPILISVSNESFRFLLLELNSPADCWPGAVMSPWWEWDWSGWVLPVCPRELWLPVDTSWLHKPTMLRSRRPQCRGPANMFSFILPAQTKRFTHCKKHNVLSRIFV